MKLDVDTLRYLSKDDFWVLTAVEMGMRNHQIVPSELIHRIARLKHGGTYKVLKNLLKHKLLHHDSSKCQSFSHIMNFLKSHTMVNRGVFISVGRQIGVGKESDIFEVATEDGTLLAMKLHQLGRVSFRAVKSKRDYLKHRSSFNWLYLSRLAAVKEFAFMKALQEHGFPVPSAMDCNRHCVVMSLVQGYPLVQVKQLQNPEVVFETIIGLIVRLAEHGLIHCDFSEFNLMIDDDEKITMIDFPQMVSVSHHNAQMYFDCDVECVFKFFRTRFHLSFEEHTVGPNEREADTDENSRICFFSIAKDAGFLDKELAASGFTRKDQEDIQQFIEGGVEENDSDTDEETEDDIFFSDTNEENIKGVDSLHLEDQSTSDFAEADELEDRQYCEAGQSYGPDTQNTIDEDQSADENDERLVKSFNKQRKHAISAAHRGRKTIASKKSYKDKGGKSSFNSKIKKQLCNWQKDCVIVGVFEEISVVVIKFDEFFFSGLARTRNVSAIK